eukprot:404439_1
MSYQWGAKSSNIEPSKLTQCTHHINAEDGTQELILSVLTATSHYNDWTPFKQYKYHCQKEIRIHCKSKLVRHPNFYIQCEDENTSNDEDDQYEEERQPSE